MKRPTVQRERHGDGMKRLGRGRGECAHVVSDARGTELGEVAVAV